MGSVSLGVAGGLGWGAGSLEAIPFEDWISRSSGPFVACCVQRRRKQLSPWISMDCPFPRSCLLLTPRGMVRTHGSEPYWKRQPRQRQRRRAALGQPRPRMDRLTARRSARPPWSSPPRWLSVRQSRSRRRDPAVSPTVRSAHPTGWHPANHYIIITTQQKASQTRLASWLAGARPTSRPTSSPTGRPTGWPTR